MVKRFLALDIGKKRIGIAVSDPFNNFSIGLDTINRNPEAKSITTISNLCKQYSIEKIIAGLPLRLSGEEGLQVSDVNEFVDILKGNIDVDIVFQDERLTSVLAQKILIEQKISPSKNKPLIDKKAAELILQQYLDLNNSKK